jgi:hypothetical protein
MTPGSGAGLNERAMAWAGAAVWGFTALAVGLGDLWAPSGYGDGLLRVLSSIYPGYRGDRTFEQVCVLTGYALVHGAAAGWLLARGYNRWAK